MANIDLVTELLKSVPMSYRLENYEQLRQLCGLGVDDMRMAFWRAEGRTDSEIEKLKKELKEEAELELLMKFISNLTTTNPAGNLSFGHPDSNLAKLVTLTNLTKSGVKFKTAFIDVFGESVYEEVLKGEHGTF